MPVERGELRRRPEQVAEGPGRGDLQVLDLLPGDPEIAGRREDLEDGGQQVVGVAEIVEGDPPGRPPDRGPRLGRAVQQGPRLVLSTLADPVQRLQMLRDRRGALQQEPRPHAFGEEPGPGLLGREQVLIEPDPDRRLRPAALVADHVELPLGAGQVARVAEQVEQDGAPGQVIGPGLELAVQRLDGRGQLPRLEQFSRVHDATPGKCRPETGRAINPRRPTTPRTSLLNIWTP